MNKQDKALLEKYAVRSELIAALMRIETLEEEIKQDRDTELILFLLLSLMCVVILVVKFI